MIIRGEMTDANTALQIGLVNYVVPQAELTEKSQEIAYSILKNGPEAIRESLACIHKGYDMALDEGLELEVQAFSNLFTTDEATEGLTAFVEKRKPDFRS